MVSYHQLNNLVNDHLVNIRELLADLPVDRVLSLGQVWRRYLPEGDEDEVRAAIVQLTATARLAAWPEWVALTARARTVRRVDFVAPTVLPLAPAALRHLCGVAEVRWQLGQALRSWDATGAAVSGWSEQPDAIAETSRGLLAVEYDAGSYSRRQVSRKAQTFHATYGQQVWGVPHAARARWLRASLPSDGEVLVAPWW